MGFISLLFRLSTNYFSKGYGSVVGDVDIKFYRFLGLHDIISVLFPCYRHRHRHEHRLGHRVHNNFVAYKY